MPLTEPRDGLYVLCRIRIPKAHVPSDRRAVPLRSSCKQYLQRFGSLVASFARLFAPIISHECRSELVGQLIVAAKKVSLMLSGPAGNHTKLC